MMKLKQLFSEVFMVWMREFRLVFTDPGVIIFFFLLPTAYPLVYTLIYNREVVREIPIVVVDHSCTAESREFLRTVNRTETFNIIGNVADLSEAREAMNSHHCFAIIEIPSEFSRRIGNGEQAVVPFYCDMSLLLRYRQSQLALTNIQLATGARLQAQSFNRIGMAGDMAEQMIDKVETESIFLGDPTQGFASFIMPGVLVIILQQSLILGIMMLAGGAAERRRANGGVDPLFCDVNPLVQIFGKVMCYLTIYFPLVIFTLRVVPWLFDLPMFGNFFEGCLLMLPMIIASAFMGLALGVFATERESAFVIFVFTSVVFLFLSGLTWPRYAMSPFWTMVSDCIPATWGVQGFVRINSDAASLAQQWNPWRAMWILVAAWGTVAIVVAFAHRRLQHKSRQSVATGADSSGV